MPASATTHSDAKPAGNIPAERTSFVGRGAELAELARRLAGGARLLTITGPGGTGKTRLARRYAHLARDAWADGGTWFCDAADVRTREALCIAVCHALDAPLAGATEDALVEQTGRLLERRGRLLLILDNLEQMLAEAASVVERWLAVAPALAIVATSREPLKLASEVRLELQPLSVPGAQEDDPLSIGHSEAVQLFVDRARSTWDDYQLDRAEASAVSAIVRTLDGLPLAIELCASRVAMLGAPRLLELLGQRFELLVRGAPSAHPRHATLRAAIDWSWELLDACERDALAQCSLFRGGFFLEEAEAILDLSAHPSRSALLVLDVLQSLRDRSLLVAYEAPGFVGRRRFRLLESIRAYAAERLGETGKEEAVVRHARAYLDLGATLAARADGPDAARSFHRLALERENLLAVCERSLEPGARDGRHAWGAQALLALEPVYLLRGPLDAFLRLLTAALERAPAGAKALRARAHIARGVACLQSGRLAEGVDDFRTAASMSRSARISDVEALARTKLALGLGLLGRGREAEQSFDRARACLGDGADPHVHGLFLRHRGAILDRRGRADEALDHYHRALGLFEAASCRRDEGITRGNIGIWFLERGSLQEGASHLAASIAILEEVGDERLVGQYLSAMGVIDQELGRHAEARTALVRALAIQRRVGARHWEGITLGYLGNLALEVGNLEEAARRYDEARALLESVGDGRNAGLTIAARAAVDARRGLLDRAEAGYDEAEARLERDGRPSDLEMSGLLRGHVDLSLALAPDVEPEVARRHLDKARQLAFRGVLGATTDEVRFARRLLEAAIRATENALAAVSSAGALIVAPDGRWFEAPGRARVILDRRASLRLILLKLVEQRCADRHAATELPSLFEAGWPDQRVHPASMAHRVHVAVATLRKLGLDGVLLTRDDGYLLDPGIEVRVGASEAASAVA